MQQTLLKQLFGLAAAMLRQHTVPYDTGVMALTYSSLLPSLVSDSATERAVKREVGLATNALPWMDSAVILQVVLVTAVALYGYTAHCSYTAVQAVVSAGTVVGAWGVLLYAFNAANPSSPLERYAQVLQACCNDCDDLDMQVHDSM